MYMTSLSNFFAPYLFIRAINSPSNDCLNGTVHGYNKHMFYATYDLCCPFSVSLNKRGTFYSRVKTWTDLDCNCYHLCASEHYSTQEKS